MIELYQILKGYKQLPHDYNDIDTAQTRLAINCVLAPFVNQPGVTIEILRAFGVMNADVSRCREFLKDLKNGSLSLPKDRKRGKIP